MEYIGECAAIRVDFKGFLDARRHRHVQILRIGGDPVNGAGLAPKLPGDHAHFGAVIVNHLRDIGGGDVLITWRCHLLARRQIAPQLKAVHLTAPVAAGHLLMQDPAAGSHPLHIACAQFAGVPKAVGVIHRAFKDIGDRFDAAVRVPRKTPLKMCRDVVAEIVKQQERVHF